MDDIDWENRNCFLTIGTTDEDHTCHFNQIRFQINSVLLFSKECLGLKRVWSICDSDNAAALRILAPLFELEGKTLSGKKLYWGYSLF